MTPHQVITEIGILATALTASSKLCFDHARNPSYRAGLGVIPLFDQGYEGYLFPDAKQNVLKIVEDGLKIPESRFVSSTDLIHANL